MKRSTPLTRRTPLRRSNPERKHRRFVHAYHSPERVRFIKHALLCCVPYCGRGPCDNAHISSDGAGIKGHYTRVVPLCWLHHRATGLRDSFHNLGSRRRFEEVWGVDLNREAEHAEAQWRDHGRHWTIGMRRRWPYDPANLPGPSFTVL